MDVIGIHPAIYCIQSLVHFHTSTALYPTLFLTTQQLQQLQESSAAGAHKLP